MFLGEVMYQGCIGKKYHQGELSLRVFRQRWKLDLPWQIDAQGLNPIPQSVVSSEGLRCFPTSPLWNAATIIISYTLPWAQTIKTFSANGSPCRSINGDTHLRRDKREGKTLGKVVPNFIHFADWWKWRGKEHHAVCIQISVWFVHLWRCSVWEKNLPSGFSEQRY